MDRKRREMQGSVVSAENEALRNPPRVGGFYSKTGYNGKPPSPAVLRIAWDVTWEGRADYYRRSAQLVDGENLAVDESHKLIKGVRVDNNKVLSGIFTVMNEHHQVVAQVSSLVDPGKLEAFRD